MSPFIGPRGLFERLACDSVLGGAGLECGLDQLRAVAGVDRFGLDATCEAERHAALEAETECLTVFRVKRTTNRLDFI